MNRLTEWDEYGNADLIALSDIMPELYSELSFSESNALTRALNKLAEYEDTGLSPVEVEKLKKLQWISVKDRLPNDEQGVLLYTREIETYGKHKEKKETWHNIYYGYCDNGEWVTSYCWGCEYIRTMNEKYPDEHIEVTHWRPLPEPPEVNNG